MKYDKELYDLHRSRPYEEHQEGQSFSCSFKNYTKNNRREIFCDFIDHLEKEGISYEADGYDVILGRIRVEPSMKAYFDGGRKGYQYNLTGLLRKLEEEGLLVKEQK